MKKLLISLVTLILSVPSFAQYNSGEVSLSESTMYYGLRLGADLANFSGDGTGDYKTRTGMTLGFVVGLHVSEETPICLESGLYYTERGGKKNIPGGEETTSLCYLELPILIKYGFELENDWAILTFVGPYFSLGAGGSIINKVNDTSISSFSRDNFSRPDMGFKLGCGAEYNHLYIEAGYQFGVANISQDDVHAVHGNAWFLNVGVNL